MVQDKAIVATASRIWSIERHRFQWLWKTPSSDFKIRPFFDAEYLRNS